MAFQLLLCGIEDLRVLTIISLQILILLDITYFLHMNLPLKGMTPLRTLKRSGERLLIDLNLLTSFKKVG